MDIVELLIGIAEIATALAGFTGVVVAFGSRSEGAWHPGDRLRLGFLLEASLTAGGFSLLALLLFASSDNNALTWSVLMTSTVPAGQLADLLLRFCQRSEGREVNELTGSCRGDAELPG